MATNESHVQYRVLIAEDTENDARLMVRVLEKAGFHFTHRLVSNREDYARAVTEFEPDVVLADYSLPSFNGLDAVRIVRASGTYTPVIIVTGTLGEETAVELMKEGVTDYVLKDRLTRLPEALRRAVAENEQRRARMQAETEAASHRARLAHLFTSSLDGILVVGARGEIVDVNPAAGDILGYEAEEMVGMSWVSIVEDTRDSPLPLLSPEGEDAQLRRLFRACRSDGRWIDLDASLSVQHESSGEAYGYVVFRDVTEQLEARRVLERDRELQRVLNGIGREIAVDGAPLLDDFARPLELVRTFLDWPVAHMYVYDSARDRLVSSGIWCGEPEPRDEPFRRKSAEYEFPTDTGLIAKAYGRSDVLWIEDLESAEWYLRRNEAVDAGLESGLAFPVIAEGRPAAVVELYSRTRRRRDEQVVESLRLIGYEFGRLFDRKRYDEQMQLRRKELESLVENAPDLIVRVTPEGRILLVNSKVSLFGFTPAEATGRNLYEVARESLESEEVSDAILRANSSVLESGMTETFEISPDIDGRTVHLQSAVVPEFNEAGEIVSLLSITRDVSEQRETEESLRRTQAQLEQSQRFDSIGRLAGGVAHDFNNILTAIDGYLYLAKASVAPDSRIGRYVTSIEAATARAGRLTHQLLLFGKRVPTELSAVDMNGIVTEMVKLLSRLIPENIDLTVRLADEHTVVNGDPGKIEQVLMNLVINARDSITEKGTITIETRRLIGREVPSEKSPSEKSPGEVQDVVCLTVLDTGVGMDRETQSSMFDPFYTTKGKERGTGLGLSVVHGIVEEHDGEIEVESTPGQGTAVHVLIPAARDDSRS
ncbi:MAG: PAS domain S-box protein, partial [Spirochaetia bacterium]